MSSIRKGNVFNGQSVSWLQVESERPYHGSIFWINPGQILSDNSRFGYLYELHRDKPRSADILKQLVSASTVKSFEVLRQRTTNTQSINNAVSTPIHGTYNQNEKIDTVIRTSKIDSPQPEIIDRRKNHKAEIWEVGPSADSTLKGVVIYDYESFLKTTIMATIDTCWTLLLKMAYLKH